MAKAEEIEGCIFCAQVEHVDGEDRPLYRGPRVFVMLNAYPYNTGHVMVAPTRHVGALEDLESDEATELIEVTAQAVRIIKQGMGCHGLNLGMNLGRVAGAGVPGHLHMHVVPRWDGDTNFMPVVADTKVLPEMLSQTRAKLQPLFDDLAG